MAKRKQAPSKIDQFVDARMGRKGNCYDNACCESFFHTLKTEEVIGPELKPEHRSSNTLKAGTISNVVIRRWATKRRVNLNC